jgi:hypothetical protein
VYGLTAAGFAALVVQSVVELRRWARRARELERQDDRPKS